MLASFQDSLNLLDMSCIFPTQAVGFHPNTHQNTRYRPGDKQLPFELIHCIIESIARCNMDRRARPTLKACSIVCRMWNHICRLYIFRAIDLNVSQSLVSRLSYLHLTAPHLSEYIIDLGLSFCDYDVNAAPGWLSDCFERLKNLRVLRINGSVSQSIKLSALRDLGIMSLLTAARIEELALEFWDDAHDPTFRPILLGCQATLKKLTLRVYTGGESTADAGRLGSLTTTSPVRLEALREFDYVNTDEVANTIRLISCPNIESLMITHSRTTHCMIPPWPTTKLSELVLNVNRDSAIPQFSKSIRPSYLTIRIRKEALQPYRSATDWIKDCMDRLPFPNHLRHLNICIITSHHRRQERFSYPSFSDCTDLCFAIKPLLEHGMLRCIQFGASPSALSSMKPNRTDKRIAVASAQRAFAPLLTSGQLSLKICF